MAEPSIVGVDWGTSSLRACLLGPDGAVLAERQSGDGILKVEGGAFALVLKRELAALDAPSGLPVVLSGMITSRQGWHECPYLACPADATALAGALRRVAEPDLGPLHFVTGLEYTSPDGLPDVMLVDWNMPEMNGLELIRAIRNDPDHLDRRDVPIVMVTTESETSQMVKALAAGASEDVMKPFTKDVIADKLSKVPGILGTQTHIAFRAYSQHDLEAAFSLGIEE